MSFLAIDVGNTRLKWAQYASPRPGAALLAHGAVFLETIDTLADTDWKGLAPPTSMLGCVVAGEGVKRRVEEQLELLAQTGQACWRSVRSKEFTRLWLEDHHATRYAQLDRAFLAVDGHVLGDLHRGVRRHDLPVQGLFGVARPDGVDPLGRADLARNRHRADDVGLGDRLGPHRDIGVAQPGFPRDQGRALMVDLPTLLAIGPDIDDAGERRAGEPGKGGRIGLAGGRQGGRDFDRGHDILT